MAPSTATISNVLMERVPPLNSFHPLFAGYIPPTTIAIPYKAVAHVSGRPKDNSEINVKAVIMAEMISNTVLGCFHHSFLFMLSSSLKLTLHSESIIACIQLSRDFLSVIYFVTGCPTFFNLVSISSIVN